MHRKIITARSHAQDTNVFYPNVLLNAIHQLLVINFLSANENYNPRSNVIS